MINAPLIQSLVSQFWLQQLGWTLLHFLWQGTAIVVVYVIVRAIAGRVLSARGRYGMACLALVAMVISPLFTLAWLPSAGGGGPDSLPALPLNITASEWQHLLPLFVLVWVAGVLGFSIRLAGGWRFTSRLRTKTTAAPAEWQHRMETIAAQVGAPKIRAWQPVRLLISTAVNVPTVIGWLRPAILLPVTTLTGLPAEHIVALLAHELAHVRRLDYLANIAQSVAEALFFYHPAVWWISRQIRDERELCCDDIAVEFTGDALTYASALAKLETSRLRRVETALAASGGSLLNRVQRLVEPAHPITDDLPGAGAVVAMALLWVFGAGVAVVQASERPESKAPVALIDSVSGAKPNPFAPGAVNTLKSTLLFDPFLTAQLAIAPDNALHGPRPVVDGPSFELADVRPSAGVAARMSGGFYGNNRFDVQSAEMLDLVRIAYDVNFDKVMGGPAWMETDRFDVSAIAPQNSTPAAMRLMLRTLLAKRFDLVVRNTTRDRSTYAIVAGAKTRISPAASPVDPGCKLDFHRLAPEPPATTLSMNYSYTCRNATMATLAEVVKTLTGADPILDETGLKGAYDFDFQFTFQAATRVAALTEALEKQVGLKLEPRMAQTPALVVENVNRQALPDAAGEAEKVVASYPKEFEVAVIRPTDPSSTSPVRNGFQPGGLVVMHGVTLRNLILSAWNLQPMEISGGPKSMNDDRFDLQARVPLSATSEGTIGEDKVDINAFRLMLRSLLTTRFGLKTHFEDQLLNGFSLVASKPKLETADPSNRTGFHEGAAAGQKDPRLANPAISRVVLCQNMTMADFAKDLPIIAGGYFNDVTRTVVDKTGLDGAYDFVLAFSGASTLSGSAGGAAGEAPTPTGQVSLFEALEKLGLKLEKERRASAVLVIDQLNSVPSEN